MNIEQSSKPLAKKMKTITREVEAVCGDEANFSILQEWGCPVVTDENGDKKAMFDHGGHMVYLTPDLWVVRTSPGYLELHDSDSLNFNYAEI